MFARDLRLRLLREHLDRAADGSEDDGLVDPLSAVEAVAARRRRRCRTGTTVAGSARGRRDG